MSKFKKAALYFGFTRTEFNIILFLTIVFVIGITLTMVKKNSSFTELKNYGYEARDSVFLNAAGPVLKAGPEAKEMKKFRDKDSVSVRVFPRQTEKPELKEKSININLAGIDDLVKLPGIGEKTAVKIIELRKAKGGFIKIEDLKEIKGIGDSKLEKLSKYIYIE
ncbi:MAG TPA: helix-hairpin-helix domain-containing protein [Ignavibacteriales bacterium]|nr:helix-hairpin-helix domain-containing protein [Ignavibacteriales bacterium]